MQSQKPACPSCGSHSVTPNGRDGVSRYAANVNFSAWKCQCGKSFTVGDSSDNSHATESAPMSTERAKYSQNG